MQLIPKPYQSVKATIMTLPVLHCPSIAAHCGKQEPSKTDSEPRVWDVSIVSFNQLHMKREITVKMHCRSLATMCEQC